MADAHKIALLIDADNTQPDKLETVLAQLTELGEVTERLAFGNWRSAAKEWEDAFRRFGIGAEHHGKCAQGKNATDIALTIAAIDLLHKGRHDTFALVSSDSDFTPLAIHLHGKGKQVIGFGKEHTPAAFRKSCTCFVCLDAGEQPKQPKPKKEPVPPPTLEAIHKALHALAESEGDAQGFVLTDAASKYLHTLFPSFRVKGYGSATMTTFCKRHAGLYEVKKVGEGKEMKALYRCIGSDTPAEDLTLAAAPDIDAVHALLREAAAEYAAADGFTLLNRAGTYIHQVQPTFKPQHYGHKKLSLLVKDSPDRYELREVTVNNVLIISYKCR